MAYFTYGLSVTTTPQDITFKGSGARGLRMSCTTADVTVQLHSIIPDAENDELVLTAGDGPFEFVIGTRQGLEKMTVYTASGTASLTVETTAV